MVSNSHLYGFSDLALTTLIKAESFNLLLQVK